MKFPRLTVWTTDTNMILAGKLIGIVTLATLESILHYGII